MEDFLKKFNSHCKELKSMRRKMEYALSSLGISHINATRLIVLFHIQKQPQMSKQIIESDYFLGKNTFYNLEKLCSIEYIIKEDCFYDKRSCLFTITQKGIDLIEKIRPFLI